MEALEPLWRDFGMPTIPPGASVRADGAGEIRDSIRLERVAYTYPGGRQAALHAVDLKLAAGKSHCFIGSTGAGKSTTLDVVLGLLRPDEGRVLIDGRPLEDDGVRAWQRHIGYVPQTVLLLDDSIANNIAFGVDPGRIDPERLERAARAAQIHDFIVRELPDGYGTLVGERGASLSGGQRQRIGIARALYRDAPVLVLDEATNELDLVTETKVLDALRSLGRRTMIFVSHRATVAAYCDDVAVFERGRVVAQGNYDSLAAPDSPLRALLENTSSRPLG
jgi:ATP-binding cassette, subfamily B, bacterial PglK